MSSSPSEKLCCVDIGANLLDERFPDVIYNGTVRHEPDWNQVCEIPHQINYSNTRVSHALNWMFHVEEVIFVQSHIKSNAEYSSEVSVVLIHPEISKASSELSTHLFRVVGRSLLGMKFSDNQGDFK